MSTGRRTRLGPAGLLLALTGLLSAIAFGGCATADRYPDGPLLLVCPWAAGGGSDRVARQLALLLEQDLQVPVNVVNATGGDGVTGHSRGALARPDGYTLTLVTVEIASLHWRGLTSTAPSDFAPIALVNRDAAAIFVRADSPWRTLHDLEAAVRAAPGTLRASGTATAAIWHLATAGWLTTVGLKSTDVIWISIAGSAPSMQELLAGGVDFVSCSLAEAQSLLKAGRIRSLGLMDEQRAPQFPDVPTFREQGVNWSLATIRGLGVPAATPPDRVRVLAAATRRIVEGAAYRDAMNASGFTPVYEPPAEFTTTLAGLDERLGALLRSEAFAGLSAKQVGPMFFPGLLAGVLGLVTLGLLVPILAGGARGPRGGVDDAATTTASALAGGAAAAPAAGVEPTVSPNATLPGASWRLAEVVLWIVIYIAAADWLGFLLTAGVLLAVHLIRLGTRAAIALPMAALLTPLVYYIFASILRVPLPRGLLGW